MTQPVCTCTDHSCESCREWFGMDPWPDLPGIDEET